MALDEVLLEAVAAGFSPPVLRLYRWVPPALTIGYAQALSDVNMEACRRLGYDVIRRPTGGRAVLHENESTYAVIARSGGIFPDTISGTYEVIAGVLEKALRSLGLPVEVAAADRRRGRQQQGICFATPVRGELLCQDCKVAGSSQKRRGRAFLQHGSIPIELDLRRLSEVLGSVLGPADSGALVGIGWLNRFLPTTTSIGCVEEALIAAFSTLLPIRLRADGPSDREWAAASQLAAEKYRYDNLLQTPQK